MFFFYVTTDATQMWDKSGDDTVTFQKQAQKLQPPALMYLILTLKEKEKNTVIYRYITLGYIHVDIVKGLTLLTKVPQVTRRKKKVIYFAQQSGSPDQGPVSWLQASRSCV